MDSFRVLTDRDSRSAPNRAAPARRGPVGLLNDCSVRGRAAVSSATWPSSELVAPFQPTGDQPQAIERSSPGSPRGRSTRSCWAPPARARRPPSPGSSSRCRQAHARAGPQQDAGGAALQRVPRLLPGQRRRVLRQSYFDYYQPEAYLPRSDTYIEKDSSRNDEIDKLRHAATRALFERKDVIIVASVTCIYGLGAPVDYGATVAAAARRRPLPAGRRAAPAGRPPVPAQRPGPQPRQVPGPRRHPGAPAGLRRLHRARPVLRRRGGAHHGARPAHRRGPRRAQRS